MNEKDRPPSAKIIPSIVSVKLNEQVKLNCSAIGVPNPKIYWTKGTDGKRISNKHLLHIEQLEEKESEEVHCHAYNRAGTSRVTATINIDGEFPKRRIQNPVKHLRWKV